MDTKNGAQQMLEKMSCDELDRLIDLLQSYRTERFGTKKAEGVISKEDRVCFLEHKADELLTEIGVPQNLLGFDYLSYALVSVAEDKTLIHGNITKKLYPKVADKFETRPGRVERAIRHAIETAWDRGVNLEDKYAFFGNSISATKGKPVNAEFIATLSKYLNREWERHINR